MTLEHYQRVDSFGTTFKYNVIVNIVETRSR